MRKPHHPLITDSLRRFLHGHAIRNALGEKQPDQVNAASAADFFTSNYELRIELRRFKSARDRAVIGDRDPVQTGRARPPHQAARRHDGIGRIPGVRVQIDFQSRAGHL